MGGVWIDGRIDTVGAQIDQTSQSIVCIFVKEGKAPKLRPLFKGVRWLNPG